MRKKILLALLIVIEIPLTAAGKAEKKILERDITEKLKTESEG